MAPGLNSDWQGSYGPHLTVSRSIGLGFGAAPIRTAQVNPWNPNVQAQLFPSQPSMIPNSQVPYSWQPASSPRIEVELTDSTPYVNQGVIYTVRTVSKANLSTIKPHVSGNDEVIVEKLSGPVTRARTRQGRTEIVNEYHYLLTPIRSGLLTVPDARISGTLAASQRWQYAAFPGSQSGGEAFDVRSDRPMALEVRPAQLSKVDPWLPLQDLKIEGGADPRQQLEIGKPITFRAKLTALGVGGERLPSVEDQLLNAGFQVYREDVQTRRILSRDGQRLTGVRTETYTLVPIGERTMGIPSIRIPWWNVVTDLEEDAILHPSTLYGAGHRQAGFTKVNPGFSFWTPFVLVLTAIASYWFGMWFRGTRLGQRTSAMVGGVVRRVAQAIARRVQPIARYVSPRNVLLWLQQTFARVMPTSVRLWYCARCIRREQDPEKWCRLFKFLACKHLEINQQATLIDLADKIAEVHPGARPVVLRNLVHQLDGAIYGGQAFEFDAWKRKWSKQLRPMWAPRFLSEKRKGRSRLPNLNPQGI